MNQQIFKTTTADDWAQIYNQPCDCKRGTIQIMFCQDKNCPDREQSLYCYDCVVEDEKHKGHKQVKIKVELDRALNEWSLIFQEYENLDQIIETFYHDVEPLFRFLDSEHLMKDNLQIFAPTHKVTLDFKEFKEIMLFLKNSRSIVEKLFNDKNLLDLLHLDSNFQEFKNSIQKFTYFSKLRDQALIEDFIFENYQSTLKVAATSNRPFTNFSKENHESFTRLKFRSLETRLTQINQPQDNNNITPTQSSQTITVEEGINLRQQLKDIQQHLAKLEKIINSQAGKILKISNIKADQITELIMDQIIEQKHESTGMVSFFDQCQYQSLLTLNQSSLQNKSLVNESQIDQMSNNQVQKHLTQLSTILDYSQAQQVINFFPEDKSKFFVKNIYRSTRDGWELSQFQKLTQNKGPTLIIIKSANNSIFGGYTSKNWNSNGDYIQDKDAFIFSVDTNKKFHSQNKNEAIWAAPNGFRFGNEELEVRCTNALNEENRGKSERNLYRYNLISDEKDIHPLTRERSDYFTVKEIEVFQVIN